jgi:hypothetical protein
MGCDLTCTTPWRTFSSLRVSPPATLNPNTTTTYLVLKIDTHKINTRLLVIIFSFLRAQIKMSPLRISSTKFSSSALILLITILSSSSHYQHVHAADTNTSSQEQNGVGNHDDTNASTDTAHQSNTTTTTIDLPKQQLPTVNNALQVSCHGYTIPYTLTTIYQNFKTSFQNCSNRR